MSITFIVTSDDQVKAYIKRIMSQLNRWMLGGKISKLVVVITDKDTGDVVERWQFDVSLFGNTAKPAAKASGTTEDGENADSQEGPSPPAPQPEPRTEKQVQDEIQAIFRQITASVTFLPVLDGNCTFNVLVYADADSDVPVEWGDSDAKEIENGEKVQLRSFSTSNHRVDTLVSYRFSNDERCKLIAQTCSTCAHVKCIATAKPSEDSNDGGSKTNAGAIAGGIVGAVVVVLAVICLWWFCIRRRKGRAPNEVEKSMPADVKSPDGSAPPEQEVRRSLAPSLASTVLTRTSNFIPIAYIPGFGNRENGHPQGSNSGDHYFTPQELRDSVYSDISSGRASITPSLARSSVSTALYRGDAVISPMPAQQAIGGKAAVVSVKSGPGSDMTSQKTFSSATSSSAPSTMLGGFMNAPTTQSPLARSMSSSDDSDSSDTMRPKIPVSGSIVARTMTPRTINIHSNKSGVTKHPMTIPEADEARTDSEEPEDIVASPSAPKIIVTEADHASSPFVDPPNQSSSDGTRPATATSSSTSGPFSDEHEVR
ncbi:serine/threonine-protein kinase KIN2 [Ascosphaera pollenicola]|nr:serine/threonine-protein kinase KIN2 [Ascosphaera pollenicola]